MTVRITKPEINISEKLSELDKPSGVAGESLLRAETPQEAFNLIGAGRKNFLINGDFQVSQRGNFTSLASVSGNGYSRVDRWYVNAAGGVSYQHKIDQTLPNGSVTNTVYQVQTGTGYTALGQKVEDLKPLLGKTVTFSFWAKSNINAGFSYYDGTSQPFGIYLIPDNTWRYYTWTTTLPSAMSQLRPEIWSNAADRPAGSYYEVAQMQLELGSVATPFEHRSYGEELALCQRYYQKSRSGVPTQNSFGGHQISVVAGQDPQAVIRLSPIMRASPSISLYSAYGSGTSGQWYGAAFNNGFSTNARAFGQTNTSFFIDNTDIGAPSTGWCEIGWTADAEL